MKRLYIHKWIISYHSFYYGFYETLYNDYEIFYQLRCLFIVKMQCTLSCKHVRSDINKQRIYNMWILETGISYLFKDIFSEVYLMSFTHFE